MKRILLLALIGLFVFPISTMAEASELPSGLPAEDVENSMDDIMNTYVGENKAIPGAAMAIVKDGKILLEKGYGMSDIENQIEVNPEETVFEAASISKLYTWSAVMQLVEQGKLDLHEDIRKYLPQDFLELEFPEKVTLLNLMNHTAGFEDTTEQLLTEDPEKVIPLKEFVSKEHEQPKQVFPPGEVTAYSNYGASLAGYIVARVSGEGFAEYMRNHLLNPLNMTHSSFEADYSHLPEITDYKSKSYVKKNNHFEQVEWAYVNDAPAGSLNTTVQDMSYFMLAHLDVKATSLFKEETTLEKMHEQTSSFTQNAHGFWERSVNQYRVLEHSGNSVGYTTQMELIPEEDFGMVLLMNVGDEMSGIRNELMNTLIGKQRTPETAAPSPNDEKVEGTYRMARGMYASFLKLLPILGNADVNVKPNEAGGITLQTAVDPEPLRYVATDDHVYERVDDMLSLMDKAGMDTSQVKFKLDDQDNVTKMTYGIVSDYLPVSVKDRVDVNLIVILLSVLTFVTFSVVSLIQWILRKRKKLDKSNKFPATGLLASIGLLVTINIIVLYSRFFQDPFQEISSLHIHVWLNVLLPVSFLISGYFMIKQWKVTTTLRNSARLFLLIISLLFILLLFNFNLLNLW